MRTSWWRLCVVLGTLIGITACRDTPVTPAPPPIRGMATDPIGDATRSQAQGAAVSPDLVSATLEIPSGGPMHVSIRWAPGTFSPATTYMSLSLDTDDIPGNGPEFIVGYDVGGQVRVSRFVPTNQLQTIGDVPVTFVANGLDAAIPLAMLGNDDGRMGFRVSTGIDLLRGGLVTVILDS